VRTRWLGLAVLVLAVGAGAVTELRSRPAAAAHPDSYVSVHFDTGRTIEQLNSDGSMPTLEQMGFRSLPVPEGMTADEYVEQLRNSSNVISAQKSVPVAAARIPNDSYYSSNQAAYLSLLGAPQAWDVSTGSNSVIVAVLDSGMDLPPGPRWPALGKPDR